MKTFYLSLTIILIAHISSVAQVELPPYYVYYIRGNIFGDGKPLKKKDRIATTTRIRFTAKTDSLKLVNAGGYVLLLANKVPRNNKNEWVTELGNNFEVSNFYTVAQTFSTELDTTYVPKIVPNSIDLGIKELAFNLSLPDNLTCKIFNDTTTIIDKNHFFEVTHKLKDNRQMTAKVRLQNDSIIIGKYMFEKNLTPKDVSESSLNYVISTTNAKGENVRTSYPVFKFSILRFLSKQDIEEMRFWYDKILFEQYLKDYKFGNIPERVVNLLMTNTKNN